MNNCITLKRGTIREYNLPINSDSYKTIEELEEREEKLRSIDGGGRREKRDLKCMQLCIRALQKAPKGTRFWNDFTDEEYTKAKAIDYIVNYGIDY